VGAESDMEEEAETVADVTCPILKPVKLFYYCAFCLSVLFYCLCVLPHLTCPTLPPFFGVPASCLLEAALLAAFLLGVPVCCSLRSAFQVLPAGVTLEAGKCCL